MDITIYRSQTESLIKENSIQQLLQELPASLRSKALRYQTDLSAYNYVVGRILLKRALENFGLDNDLEKIDFQESGKPIVSGIHFNISHSDHQVVCAFSKDGQLGVDLEKIRPINFEDFTSVFTAQEWTAIKGAEYPLRAFYWFWTRKESIIKALGRNLSYLHQIELDVTLDHFVVDEKPWFLRDLDVGKDYIGAICCEIEIGKVELIDVRF